MHSVNQLCSRRAVSAGVKELLRSHSANGAKSNFMQRHSTGEMINGFHVSPSVGAVPSSPRSWREWAPGQPGGGLLPAHSAAEPSRAPCSFKRSWDLGKGEKKFLRAGVNIPMPGRASPAAWVSPPGHPGSASPLCPTRFQLVGRCQFGAVTAESTPVLH